MKFITTDFQLDRGIPLPNEIAFHRVSDKHLVIAPAIPAYAMLDDAEAEAVYRLTKGASLEEAAICLTSWGESTAQDKLSSLISKLALEGFLVNETGVIASSDAITLQLHLTNSCNLRCTHCYVSSGKALPVEMPLEKWIEIIDAAAERHSTLNVGISGGEPTLVPWLPDLLARIKSRGGHISVLTNGMLWTDRRVSELHSYVDLVNVSLDGASEPVHDTVRGKGSFRQAMRGIQRIGSAGIKVGINICLMKSNIKDIEFNFHSLVKSFPFPVSVLFGKFVEEGRGRDVPDERVSAADLARVLPILSAQFLGSGWRPTTLAQRQNCGFGRSYAIYANGDISPCLSPVFIAGNALKEGAATVFDRIISNSRRVQVDNLPLCRTCDLRYLCGGKCHLHQLNGAAALGQNECSSKYRSDFRERLAERALTHESNTLSLLSHPM